MNRILEWTCSLDHGRVRVIVEGDVGSADYTDLGEWFPLVYRTLGRCALHSRKMELGDIMEVPDAGS